MLEVGSSQASGPLCPALQCQPCGWSSVFYPAVRVGPPLAVEPLPIRLIMSSSGRSYILLLPSCSGPGLLLGRLMHVQTEVVNLHSSTTGRSQSDTNSNTNMYFMPAGLANRSSFLLCLQCLPVFFHKAAGRLALVCLCLPDTLTLSQLSCILMVYVQYRSM